MRHITRISDYRTMAIKLLFLFCYKNIEYRIGEFKKLSDNRISDLGLNLPDYQILDSEKTIGCSPLVCTLVLFSLATLMYCIEPSVSIMTKSLKVEPPLTYSISLVYTEPEFKKKTCIWVPLPELIISSPYLIVNSVVSSELTRTKQVR